MKKALWRIALVLLMCAAVSCGVKGIEPSSPDSSLMDMATKTYTKAELSEIGQYQGTIKALDEKYPMECIRKIGDTYRVSYLGEESVAVLLFDRNGNRLFGDVYTTRLLKSDFSGLSVGGSLAEVKAIDPNGAYPFLHTGRNDVPKESSHYTKDGYVITVKYDDSHTIIHIREELL